MALYKVEGPDKFLYEFEGPDDAPVEQRLAYASQLHQKRLAAIKEHDTKTGFISSVKAGAREALAGTEEALGFDQAAEEQRQKAAKTHEGTTQEDIERAKAKGVLPAAGAYLEKYVAEPLGGMVGRFGAPIAAGMAAPLVAPEAALGLLGEAGVTAAGVALTDFLPEMGENVKAQKDAGKDPNYVTAALVGGVQAYIAALGVPGAGKVNKLVGPKLIEEAKLLAPEIIEGKLTLDAAKKELTGKWTQYAQNMGVNTISNTGLMVGTEELRRAQAGQDLMSGQELAETAGQAALLSPIFGAMNLRGPRAKAETILEAGKVKYDKIQNELGSLRELAQTRELTRQENIKIAELQQQARDIQAEMEKVKEANQSNAAANKAYEAQQADYRRPLKDQLELPLGETIEDKKAKQLEGGKQGDLFTEPAETPPPPQEPYTITNKLLTSLGVGRSAYAHDALVGFDANDPTQNKIIRSVLDEHAKKTNVSPKTVANIETFLNDTLPKTGEQNVTGQPELKPEGNRDGVSSTSVRGLKPTKGIKQADVSAVESNRDIIGRSNDGKTAQSAALETKQPRPTLQDQIEATKKEINYYKLFMEPLSNKEFLDRYDRPKKEVIDQHNGNLKDLKDAEEAIARGELYNDSIIEKRSGKEALNEHLDWLRKKGYAWDETKKVPASQETLKSGEVLGAYYDIADKEQKYQQQVPQEGQLKAKSLEYVKPEDKLTPTSFMDRLSHPDPSVRYDARVEFLKTVREQRNIERSKQESEIEKNLPPVNELEKRAKYLSRNLEQMEDAPKWLVEDLKNATKSDIDIEDTILRGKEFLVSHGTKNDIDKILKRKATPQEVEAFDKLQNSLFRYEPKKLGKNKESEFAKDPQAYNAMIDAFIEDYTGLKQEKKLYSRESLPVDQVYYRGTDEEYDDVGGTGGVIYLSPNRNEAAQVGGSIVTPYRVKVKNTFDINNKAHFKKVLAELSGAKNAFFKGKAYKNSQREIFKQALEDNPNFNYAPYEIIEEFAPEIESAGFDSFFVKEQAGYATGAKNIAVFNASQLQPIEKLPIEDYTGKREPLLQKQEIKSDDMYAKQPEAISDTGRTKENIIKEVLDAAGPNAKKAMDRGDLNIISSKEIPKGATVPANSPAFYHEGKAYLIHDRLNEGEALGYLHHETGVHYGLEKMVSAEIYNDVLKRFEYLNGKDQRVTDAHAFVDKNYAELKPGSKEYQEEVLARLVESAPNHSLVRRIIAAVKNFLLRKGLIKADTLSVKDLHDLVSRSLRESLAGNLKGEAKEGIQFAKKQPEPNAHLNDLFKKAGGNESTKDPGLFHTAYNNIKEINKDKTSFLQKTLDKAETMFFSSDAAFNNRIVRSMEKDGLSWDTMKKVMYQISTSQALHREALAHQFIEHGGIEYNTTEHKYVVTDSPHSWKKMVESLDEAAKLNGVPLSEMQKYAGQALIARRYGTVDGEFGNGIVAKNKIVEDHTRDLNVRNKQKDATEYYSANHKFVHLSEEEIAAGLKLFKELKGMDKVVEQWNKTRENTLKAMVDSGLYNEMDAKILLDAIEYVPFYRVEQLENRAGPKDFSRGIVDLAKDKKFRGSEKEINNVFDNMERWVSYAIRKSVGNRAATDLVQAALKHIPDEVRKVDKVNPARRENTTGVWVDGEVQHFEFDDPLFVHAFTGMEPIVIPALSTAAKFTNLLRKNIVLNPLFSIGQLSQDGFNAMITSGVKHPFAIPLEVFKELVKTLSGTSKAHEELTARGATGTKDWSSAVSRIEAEMKSNLLETSNYQRIKGKLENFSMASDNAVRQAIYNRTLLETGGKKINGRIEGGDKALAVERAFEVINFRRSGASGSVNFLRQTVPFFGAYLQALNVTGKVLMGRGIGPSQKAEARKVLASTLFKVSIASLVYNMMISDDEGYKKLDPSVRDKRLIVPGTDGLSLPLRSDLFTFISKILPEHIYQMNLDQGAEDGTKAAHALKMGLINAIASPNVMPQAIKPIFEVSLNKDFYTGRDIVGQGISERNTEDQYTPNTSELAKVLGSTGMMSPMKVDYILKAYFGYTAGLGLMAVDRVIAASEDKSPPEKSFRDTIASIPGAAAFVSHEFGNKDVTDFYELRELVNTAVNSYNFKKSYGTAEETKNFREENKEILQVQAQVNNINRNLTTIRHQETKIMEAPNSEMSPEEKGVKIRELRLRKQKMLSNIEDLRKRAGL